jgi:hypothetical protein
MISEIIPAAEMSILFFRAVTPYGLVGGYRRFGETGVSHEGGGGIFHHVQVYTALQVGGRPSAAEQFVFFYAVSFPVLLRRRLHRNVFPPYT